MATILPYLTDNAEQARRCDLATEFAQELVWLYERTKDTDPDLVEEFGRFVEAADAYLRRSAVSDV